MGFQKGDRVYISKGGLVGTGLKGTVVGMNYNGVLIKFDKSGETETLDPSALSLVKGD